MKPSLLILRESKRPAKRPSLDNHPTNTRLLEDGRSEKSKAGRVDAFYRPTEYTITPRGWRRPVK